MKVSEFKLRMIRFGNNMIDIYFPGEGMVERMISSSAKYILKNKINELDGILNMFADSDKNLNAEDFISFMKENMIRDGIKINIREYLPENSQFKNLLPDRTLVIKQEDLNQILQ